MAPANPNTTISQLKIIEIILSCPLNEIRYRIGGNTNAIAAEPIDPAMFRKSVKFGMRSEIPVISHTIKDLTKTFLTFLILVVPELNQSQFS